MSRWEHEERLERMAAQVQAHPKKLAARKTIIEHCWGTLHWLLPGGFLVKGLKQVRAEASLAAWAYNLRRALAVLAWTSCWRRSGKWRGEPEGREKKPGAAFPGCGAAPRSGWGGGGTGGPGSGRPAAGE